MYMIIYSYKKLNDEIIVTRYFVLQNSILREKLFRFLFRNNINRDRSIVHVFFYQDKEAFLSEWVSEK